MARLLVVSRSMALALRLADTHDVVEASADALADLCPSPDLDAVVLDVGEPALAIQTIDRLRRDGDATPLLVVSGYQSAWAGLTAIDVPGVVVVPLPVTRAALLEGIDRLLTESRHPVPAGPAGPAPVGTGADGAPADGPGPGTDAVSPVDRGWQGGGFNWWGGIPGPASADGDAPAPLPAGATGPSAPGPFTPGPFTPGPFTPGPFTPGPFTPGARPGPPAEPADAGPARPLRRGWPPHGGEPDPAADQRPAPAGPAGPAGPVDRDTLGSTLLGRSAHGAADMSVFRRRLAGRTYATSLGPGGTSPELVALGTPVPVPTGTGTTTAAMPPTGAPTASAPGLAEALPAPGPADRADTPHDPLRGEPRRSDARGEPQRSAPVDTAPVDTAPVDTTPVDTAPVDALVDALVERIREVAGVTDACRAVADRAATAARAAACAVLVPDEGCWRVGGGHGLRAAERTMVLDASHWLVETLLAAGRPIVLAGTDLARRRPEGLPLGTWRQLLVAPVPPVRALVVLARARDGDAFGPADVSALAEPLAQAAPLLQSAVRARSLARLLAPLRDLPPDGGGPR